MINYYQILDVVNDATGDEIKAQWKRKVKIYHPDRHPNNPFAHEQFKRIKEAYEVLSNPIERKKYNSKLFAKPKMPSKNESSTKPQEEIKSSSFGKEVFGKLKNMAFTIAQDVVLDMAQQTPRVDPFIDKTMRIRRRRGSTGALQIAVEFTSRNQDLILKAAAKGMSMEDYAEEIGTLISEEIVNAFVEKWRKM